VLAATAREIDALSQSARVRIGETLARLAATLAGTEAEARHNGEAAPVEILRHRVMAFIDENLGDPQLSIDMVAAALKCSKRYIHRTFEGSGTTPERYLWEARLERCRQDLLSTGKRQLTISEIAFASGFNSSAHFSRTFRGRYGMTPREFRATQAELWETYRSAPNH
jgi:AraC-like DNA-binding protein